MDFFKQLTEIVSGLDLTMKIEQKDGQLSIRLFPSSVDKVHPLLLCGTAAELDEGFMGAIRQPLSDTKTLLTNSADYMNTLNLSIKEKIDEAGKSSKNKAASPAKKAPEKGNAEEQTDEEADESLTKQSKKPAKKKAVPAKNQKEKPEKIKESKPAPAPVAVAKPEHELTPLERLMQ